MKHGLQVMTVVLWAKKYILQEEKKVQDVGMMNQKIKHINYSLVTVLIMIGNVIMDFLDQKKVIIACLYLINI